MLRTRIHIPKIGELLNDRARAGVSLHCHTRHSREALDFIPYYAERLPVISHFWRQESEKYEAKNGRAIDLSTSYWTPPLSPKSVHDHECSQIVSSGLDPMVSITDHDSIDANLELNAVSSESIIPISLEWTVPFKDGFFHIGVHNLPQAQAPAITVDLLEYTNRAAELGESRLTELFEMLDKCRDVLIVFNHPIWDIERIGDVRHRELLAEFVADFDRYIHAYEVNGFRSWSENREVIALSESLGKPIVTGGDRHGCQANTVINLTRCADFSEFVDELRQSKRSEIALLPAYEVPIHSRQLQSFAEILGALPDDVGRERWFDRVFVDTGDGRGAITLAEHGWSRGGPFWMRWAVSTLAFLGSTTARPLFRLAQSKADRIDRRQLITTFELPTRPVGARTIGPDLSGSN